MESLDNHNPEPKIPQHIQKFLDSLQSLSPWSDTGLEVAVQKTAYRERVEAIKENLPEFARGLFELSKLSGEVVDCEYDTKAKSASPINIKVEGSEFPVGIFYPAATPEQPTKEPIFKAGSRFVAQNFKGESNNNEAGKKASIECIDELLLDGPESVFLPAFYPGPELIEHITKKGYNILFTRITSKSDGSELLGNATLIRSDIKLPKLKLQVSVQGQVPQWHWQSKEEQAKNEIRPNVYSNQILEFNPNQALALVYTSPFTSSVDRLLDFINLTEILDKYQNVLASGDFNTFGLASDVYDISLISDFLKDVLPAATWNFKGLNKLIGGGSASELELYHNTAKQLGFDLFIPKKATIVLPGIKGKASDFRLDATLIKGCEGKYTLSDTLLPGMDHLNQSFCVTTTDNPNATPSDELGLIKSSAILKTNDTRFYSILKMNVLALVIGFALAYPIRVLANSIHNIWINPDNPVQNMSSASDHLNGDAR